MADVTAIIWSNNILSLLDQRLLPIQEIWLEYTTTESVYEAIRDMVVRGAPAIGISAAYGAVFAAQESVNERCLNDLITPKTSQEWFLLFDEKVTLLASSRPTAVNLFWALQRIKETISDCLKQSITWSQLIDALKGAAIGIHQDDIENNKKMGELGAGLITASMTNNERPFSLMTHCNAGAIATGGYGTALGVVRSLWKTGQVDAVYADETRPWLQGARLTAWELQKEGIYTILNADVAAAQLMATKNIKWVIVGADRITANGDVANKIGTYGLAILAKYHDVKVMVVAPVSTIDMALSTGKDIPIEERSAEELTNWQGVRTAPEGIDACNPVFDVTPASLIEVIVTEKGVVEQPTLEKMRCLMAS